MANIMFKRGAQSALPTKAQDGVFYLTTDTDRLYVGQGEKMTLLNQQVHIVANTSDIPKYPDANDFYYCSNANVLAFYDGTEWKQINPDTNDTIKVDGVTVGDPAITTNQSIDYKISINQAKYNNTGKKTEDLTAVDFTLKLTKADLEQILEASANIGLSVRSGTNSAIVTTQGDGANSSQSATIIGGDNTFVSVNGSDITISAVDSQYELTSLDNNSAATIRLKDTTGGKQNDIVFKAGSDLSVSADSTGITYSHATINTIQDDSKPIQGAVHGAQVALITEVQTDNGHVTKIVTEKYTLPQETTIKQINGTATSSENADWKVQIEETGAGKTFDIDFSKDAEALESKLTSTINNKLAAANTALTYKGTISVYSSLTSKTSVEIGDVYLLSSKDGNYDKGDMFIATVKEGGSHDNGVIASGSVEWTHIPSGDELNTDTLFKGDVVITGGGKDTGKIEYKLSAKRGADDSGTGDNPAMPAGHEDLSISAGEDIVINGEGSNAIVGHKVYSNATVSSGNAQSSSSFKAITGVTLTNGHVTEIKEETFTPETYTLVGTNNEIKLKNGAGADVASIDVSGDSWVQATVNNNGLTLTHAAPSSTVTNKTVTNGTLTHGGKLKILTGVSYDAKGHVSSVSTGEVTLPKDNNTTYDMFVGANTTSSTGVTSATSNPYIVLRNDAGANDTVQIKGDEGSLSVSGTSGAITIGMVWGSF